MEAVAEKHEMMSTAPVEALICRLAAPSIAIMLISQLYNVADTYFVSHIGTSATAAVGISFSLMAVIQAVGFFFGHGAGNYISRALGKRDTENAEKMAATGFFSAAAVSGVLAVAGLIFLEPLARLLGATETIMPYALDYLRYILIAAPFMATSLMLNNLLRFQGSALFAMIGMMGGAVLNIGLDPLFIFVFRLGVSGAAIATMISQTASCILLFAVCGKAGNIPIRLRSFSPSRKSFLTILGGGSPSLLRQTMAGVATICLNQSAGPFGDAAIAAMSIVSRVVMFLGSAFGGFGQGMQPVAGFNYGAGLYGRAKKAFWFCVKVSTFALALSAVLCYALAPQILSLFRGDDARVIEIGALALRLQCFSFPFLGWVIICNMFLQVIGKSVQASILGASRQGLFMIVFLVLLVPRLGLFGILLSVPLSDTLTFILSVPLQISVLKGMKDR